VVHFLVWVISAALKPKALLVAENLCLRQQLLVLQRRHPQPRLRNADRQFWICASRLFAGWRNSLLIVKPETVLRWHRRVGVPIGPGARIASTRGTAIRARASDEWAKNLDDKDRLFEGYLQTLNKREAALYAGWSESTAKRWAYEIFKRPHVREAIEHLLRTRTGVTKAWLVDKLVAIIDTDLADVSDWDADGDLVFKTSGELTAEQKVAVSQIAQERGRDGARTLKIRLYDKLAAMGHLAKLLNMLVERQEISGPDGGPVEVMDHRARITERLNDIAKRQAPDTDGASGGA
jgi:hypothetical protein